MRQSTIGIISAVTLASLVACGGTTAKLLVELGISEGVWVSDGYGYVIDVRQDNQELYHLAGDTCILDYNASSELDMFLTSDTVHPSKTEDVFDFGVTYEPHRTVFTRQASLPDACLSPATDTTEGNFQAFADVFAAHYAFFDLYDVNWNHQVKTARQSLSPEMTDAALFQLFAEMIAPLKDGHLELEAEIDGVNYNAAPKTTPLSRGVARRAAALGISEDAVFLEQLEAYWVNGINERVLQGAGTQAAGGKIQYGLIDGNIGYIAVLMLTGFAEPGTLSIPDDPDDENEYRVVNEVMDDIMTDFADAGVEAVIIDASVNFGGHDYLGREIAARFADKKRLVLTKQAFDAQHTAATPVYIEPTDRPSFNGPVYLMTTQSTVSAGEIMTLALRALPQVTHVGQATQGALSDILYKSLPNGWEIGMSNEVYYDPDGILWEGRGIAPERPIDIFSETDLVSRHPAAVEELSAHIRVSHSH